MTQEGCCRCSPHQSDTTPEGLIKKLGLGSSLGFTHALLQALGTAMTATIKFFFTFNFLVSHSSLRGEPH